MIYARYAVDAANSEDMRRQHFEAHRTYLRSGKVDVLQSGPLMSGDGTGRKVGGLVIFDCPDAQTANAFNAGDPFVLHGVYADARVFEWRKTIG